MAEEHLGRYRDSSLDCPLLFVIKQITVMITYAALQVRLMAKEHLGRYRNSSDCLKQVLQQEGPAALFIGLAPTLYRNCIWNCLYYGSMHAIDQQLPQLESHGAAAARQLAIGTAVGVAATCANAPFDVVKSRCGDSLCCNVWHICCCFVCGGRGDDVR